MKTLVYTAPNAMEVQQRPDPRPGPDEVLIRVVAAGVCGSDVHGFQGRSRIRVPPMIMGHEFTGRIEAFGPLVEGLEIGQRVVVQPLVGCGHCVYCLNGRSNICPDRRLIGGHRQGAFAEWVTAPARVVYPMPDRLTDIAGSFVEPLGNAVHMMGLGAQPPYRDVVVLGAGTLGLLTVATAKLDGARRVIVTDVDPHRLEIASRLGADDAVNISQGNATERINELTEGGAPLVIDCAGFTSSRQQAIALARPGATVVLLGLGEPQSEISFLDVINRELDLRGSYSCTDEEFRRAIAILADGKIDVSFWHTIATLDEGPRRFEELSSHSSDLVKVVFEVHSS